MFFFIFRVKLMHKDSLIIVIHKISPTFFFEYIHFWSMIWVYTHFLRRPSNRKIAHKSPLEAISLMKNQITAAYLA